MLGELFPEAVDDPTSQASRAVATHSVPVHSKGWESGAGGRDCEIAVHPAAASAWCPSLPPRLRGELSDPVQVGDPGNRSGHDSAQRVSGNSWHRVGALGSTDSELLVKPGESGGRAELRPRNVQLCSMNAVASGAYHALPGWFTGSRGPPTHETRARHLSAGERDQGRKVSIRVGYLKCGDVVAPQCA